MTEAGEFGSVPSGAPGIGFNASDGKLRNSHMSPRTLILGDVTAHLNYVNSYPVTYASIDNGIWFPLNMVLTLGPPSTVLMYVSLIGIVPIRATLTIRQTLGPKFFGGAPDIVSTGPNVGSNLGFVTLFSGTVYDHSKISWLAAAIIAYNTLIQRSCNGSHQRGNSSYSI